ncbi:MAG: AtpZ/AtpI family protein [Gemmatimonadaceae bacterium]|nr:AtpZ/AtpI family protein [Gemmatimonadaceae bacterium]
MSPWALAGLGMQFCVAILIFVYVGNWLDRRFDTAPLFLLSGVFLGGGGAFYSGYRRLMASATRDTDEESSES